MTATVIATSLLGSAAMAADAITTTDTGVSTPIAKEQVKTGVKAPAKHLKHKKSTAPKTAIKSEDKLDTSKVDSSVKTDSTVK